MHGYQNHKSKHVRSEKLITILPRAALPGFPEFPAWKIDSTISLVNTPVVDRHAGDDECDNNEGLQGLSDDSSAEKEQAHAAEDDGCGDPGAVGSFELGFTDAEDDKAEHGEEVEGVSCDTVKGDESAEFADYYVDGRKDTVECHGVDGREAEFGFVAQETGEGFAGPGAAA